MFNLLRSFWLHRSIGDIMTQDIKMRLYLARKGLSEDLDILRNDTEVNVLLEVAKYGRPQDLHILLEKDREIFHNKQFPIMEEYIKNCPANVLHDMWGLRINELKLSLLKADKTIQATQFMNDPDVAIREYIVKLLPENILLDFIKKEESIPVLIAIVARDIMSINDKLVYHKIPEVRAAVAKLGHKKYLDILVYDDYWFVRAEVAPFAEPHHFKILSTDSSYIVKKRLLNKAHNNKQLDMLRSQSRI